MQGTRNIRNWIPVFTGNPGFLLEFIPYLSIRPDHGIRGRNDNIEIGFGF
jgi:hypothetical protein